MNTNGRANKDTNKQVLTLMHPYLIPNQTDDGLIQVSDTEEYDDPLYHEVGGSDDDSKHNP